MTQPPDAETFTALYNAYYLPVLRFVRRRVGTDNADDIVSETFLVAWRRFDDLPQDETKPWLFGVAYNVMSRNQRSRGRQHSLRLRIAAQPDSTQENLDADVSRQVDLSRAWAHLNDQDQETLALIAWDGLTSAEAAVVVGCSRSAFSARVTRARRRLRTLLYQPKAADLALLKRQQAPSPTKTSPLPIGEPS